LKHLVLACSSCRGIAEVEKFIIS